MTLPHQCRCAICGEIGVITPGLPNVFNKDGEVVVAQEVDINYAGEERRLKAPIVPTETSPYASSRADELAPRAVGMVPALGAPFADIPTCTHGYRRCMPCKFPPP